MSISLQEVRKIASLARLSLTAEEEKQYTDQLSAILDYIDKLGELKELSIEGTKDFHNLEELRLDEADGGRRQEQILSLAPTRQDDLVSVPAVFAEQD